MTVVEFPRSPDISIRITQAAQAVLGPLTPAGVEWLKQQSAGNFADLDGAFVGRAADVERIKEAAERSGLVVEMLSR